jgi:oligopeptide transport system permease protein
MTVQERAASRLAIREQRETNLWTDAIRRLVRNRAALVGTIIVILLILTGVFANQIAPFGYAEGDSNNANTVPAWLAPILPVSNLSSYAKINNNFLLGSDILGRDILSRLIFGIRVSLPVGFIGALTSLIIGLTYGSISGYYGGKVDNVMMRIVDIMYAFPTILLIILLMAFFKSTFTQTQPGSVAYAFNQASKFVDKLMGLRGGGMLFIFMGIGLTAWMGMARLARGQILSLKEKEFIEAAHTVGAGDLRIMARHVLPNILGPCIVAETLAIPNYINYEVFLSFIGLGVDAPTPSWGSMISEGSRSIRSYPHQILFPALALSITMFAFNFLGDGLRDALDPRMRGT